MPDASSAASSEPPLKVACSFAMALRSYRDLKRRALRVHGDVQASHEDAVDST